MALPALKSLEDCADYSKVIEPFLPQLYELPSNVFSTVTSGESLLSLYADTNPLVSGFAFSIFIGGIFWIASEVNRNYSQVDRFWSLLPAFYNAHFSAWTHLNNLPSQRVDLVLLWSAIWSARLTFNYWRKGGYEIGSEDYRWEIIRGRCHPVIFFIFNATFISFIQSILLFLLAAPTYVILLASKIEPKVGLVDLLFTITELALVLSEWFSDQQQWDYQTAKRNYQQTAKIPQGCGHTQEDLNRGFITSGLWAYCRHPNFTGEQTICWAASGPLFLIMLFQGSTWLTELLTAGKYPEYKSYQKQVGVLLPSLRPYKPVVATPKIIRTSDLAKREKSKEK
ncbi:hypothetical protein E0Z10_g1044 [Xylaria hypoxylon]|uniref:Steroid 5-alpha reductase C-terminal domain-containing protein n=1 Tax=Xylaria hypoxylon TaxID=37992 RepID=A0A4Z0Z886_9PEZI|nr:hypothetical protein E0Z10_g1044 [Xylaria hypoxylon]